MNLNLNSNEGWINHLISILGTKLNIRPLMKYDNEGVISILELSFLALFGMIRYVIPCL